MFTVVLFIVIAATAILGGIICALEAADPWIQKVKRRLKRQICSRWLAEDGLTVVPMKENVPEPEAVHTTSVDELISLINEY